MNPTYTNPYAQPQPNPTPSTGWPYTGTTTSQTTTGTTTGQTIQGPLSFSNPSVGCPPLPGINMVPGYTATSLAYVDSSNDLWFIFTDGQQLYSNQPLSTTQQSQTNILEGSNNVVSLCSPQVGAFDSSNNFMPLVNENGQYGLMINSQFSAGTFTVSSNAPIEITANGSTYYVQWNTNASSSTTNSNTISVVNPSTIPQPFSGTSTGSSTQTQTTGATGTGQTSTVITTTPVVNPSIAVTTSNTGTDPFSMTPPTVGLSTLPAATQPNFSSSGSFGS